MAKKQRTNNKDIGRMLLLDSNPKRIDMLIKALTSGMPIIRACEYSGVNQATYFNYMNKAEEDMANGLTAKESPFIQFFDRVNSGRNELYQNMLQLIAAAAPYDWRAANALLDKLDPEIYGKKEVTNNTTQIVVSNDIPNE